MTQLGSFYRQDVGERSRGDSLSVGQQIDGWGVNWAKQMWICVWRWLGSLGLQSLCWPLPTSSRVSPNSRPTGGVWTFLNGSEMAPIWMWHPFTSQETFKKVKARIDGGIARGAGVWATGFSKTPLPDLGLLKFSHLLMIKTCQKKSGDIFLKSLKHT